MLVHLPLNDMNQRINASQTPRVIVHLVASPFFGGPERQMLGLANHLDETYRSVFLSFAEQGLAESFLQHTIDAGHEAIALQSNTPHFVSCIQEVAARLRKLRTKVRSIANAESISLPPPGFEPRRAGHCDRCGGAAL